MTVRHRRIALAAGVVPRPSLPSHPHPRYTWKVMAFPETALSAPPADTGERNARAPGPRAPRAVHG